jgi:cell division transport system permease protein
MRMPTPAFPLPWKVAITQAQYLLQETVKGLRRGSWMNWAAVSTVTVLLFLLGLSLQTNWQINGLLNQVGSQLEISVYLKPNISGNILQQQIQQFPSVTAVSLVPRDQAWKQLIAELGATDLQGATDALGQNPLVDELKIQSKSASEMPKLVQMLTNFPEVDHVSYLNEVMQNLAQLNRGLNQMGWAVIGLLTLTALAVINTTIRLIVVARHQEIEVMQLVGATTTWIYLPFLLQGVFFGLIGGGAAIALMAGAKQFMQQILRQQPEFLQTLTQDLHLSAMQSIALPISLLVFGSFIGLMGSFLAVRRFILR